MAEHFANVIARLIVNYLTLLVMSLAILAGYWIIEDYNVMIEFIKYISDNTFVHIVVWIPFVFSWFKQDKRGNVAEILNARMRCSAMSCSLSGRW